MVSHRATGERRRVFEAAIQGNVSAAFDPAGVLAMFAVSLGQSGSWIRRRVKSSVTLICLSVWMGLVLVDSAVLAQANSHSEVDSLTKSIKKTPNDAVLYVKRGLHLSILGEYESAIVDYNKAIQMASNNQQLLPIMPTVFFNRANAYKSIGKHEAAIEDYDKTISLSSEVGQYVYAGRAYCSKQLGRFREADADYKRELALFSEDPAAHADYSYFLGTCPELRFRDGTAAVAHASKAVELAGANDPLSATYLRYLAYGYAELHEVDKSLSTLDAIPAANRVAMDVHDSLRIQKGEPNGLWELGDHADQNLEFLSGKIADNSKDSLAFYQRGLLLVTLGNTDEAMRDLAIAIDLGLRPPTYLANAHCERGVLLRDSGRPLASISEFTQAIKKWPGFSQAYSGRGYARFHSGDYQLAAQDFDQAIRIDSRNADAYRYLAVQLACCTDDRIRDGKRAIELASKACELYEWKHPHGILVLAAAFAEAGDYAKASELTNELTSKVPEGPLSDLAASMNELFQRNEPLRMPSSTDDAP